MRHRFLLLLLCGLAACGGNGGRQSAQEPAANADSPAAEEIVPTFRRVPVPADCQGVAFEAYRAICALDGAEITMEAPEDCTLSYTTVTDDIEGYYEQTTYDCFPRPGGGWLVIETWCGGAEGEATAYISKAYDFSDGKATELEGGERARSSCGLLPRASLPETVSDLAHDQGRCGHV